MIPTVSTVVCPQWTLAQVAERLRASAFESVELRSYGVDSRRSACDPSMTSAAKVLQLFFDDGIEIEGVATSLSFSDPISPPVIGRIIGDPDKAVRHGRQMIDIARGVGAKYLRVFGHELPPRESRGRGVARVAERLSLVVAAARNSGVQIVIENGGSFESAEDLLDLVERVREPGLGVCLSLNALSGEAPAVSARDAENAVRLLGRRIRVARLADVDDAGRGVIPGEGVAPCAPFVEALGAVGFEGPVVWEHHPAWSAVDLETNELVQRAGVAMSRLLAGADAHAGAA